ncbi:MAG TPA: hypothetical protein VK590_08270 [Saprospiraceae bacterium]|nr:hypothetical protein [Saprospiraceae bacterium]
MTEVNYAYLDDFKSKFGKRVYRKKPIEIEAYQMNEDFHVETLEGTMNGKTGDYVIIGIRGELYICNEEIFNSTYDFVDIEKI